MILISLASYMGSLYQGYHLSVTNLSFNTLKYKYGIQDDLNLAVYQGLFNLAMAVGAAIASILFSSILKVMGRRQTMIVTDIIGITGSLFFLGANIWVGTVGRFICGFAVGINSAIVPLYV